MRPIQRAARFFFIGLPAAVLFVASSLALIDALVAPGIESRPLAFALMAAGSLALAMVPVALWVWRL